jgi:hypothetical protein
VLAAALLLVGAACGGESATEPSLNAARLVLPDQAPDTVSVGGVVESLSVRVENPAGEPVEGVPVRFLLVSGPGEVMPNLAVTNGEGVAETEFRGGGEFGTSVVRTDIPSASNVESRRLEVVTVPAGEVTLAPEEGRGQRAEAGSQLPVPFRVRVTTPDGTPSAGVRVEWRVESGPSDARLGPDTTFTDDQGRTETLLTLGSTPGEHVVTAHAVGGVVTDTARFRAEAVSSLSTSVTVDSVAPLPLAPGGEAVLLGEGFARGAGDPQVRVEGVVGDVVEASADRIRFRVPDFEARCLPARDVGVRAIVADEVSNGKLVRIRPGTPPLDMEVGEVEVRQGSDAVECLQLGGGSGERQYLVTAGTAGRTAAETRPLRLFLNTGGGDRSREARAVSASRSAGGREAELPEDARPREIRIREQARRELDRQGIRGSPRISGDGDAALRAASTAAPSVGDTLRHTFAVGRDLAVACGDTSRVVEGVVRAVGSNVVLVEDVDVPGGSFPEETWRTLRDEFDEVVFPTDTLYFGGPADIDGNGRVVVLFTPQVNRLTPRSATGRVGGFFLPLDLTDSGDPAGNGLQGPGGEVCPASNEGELLYLAAADPEGAFGRPLREDQALRNARSVVAHELEHLLSAEQRLVLGDAGFDGLGEVWLQEGLAHVAEEAVGLRLMDRAPGGNITWEEIEGDRRQLDRFNTFHLNNFARLDLFMRRPTAAPVLATADPGGVAGLQMRGFAWSLLRWAADRTGSDGEPGLFRSLSRGGPSHLAGIENLERATGRAWTDLLAEYRLALALDDAGVEGSPPELGFATWDVRSVFAGLSENPASGSSFPFRFPLAVTDLPLETTAVDFDVRAGTAAYFRLQSTRGSPPAALRLAGQSRRRLDDRIEPQLSVVRTR